jgi:DNA-directed RNA polymerase specialized sigma24 family protein
VSKEQSKKEPWNIDEKSWRKFLNLLDSDPVEAEKEFKRLKEKLTIYVSKRRGSFKQTTVEELVDETVQRTVRKVNEKGFQLSGSILSYSLGVAHHVLQEYWKEAETERARRGQFEEALQIPSENIDERVPVKNFLEEQNLECLQECLEKLFSPLEIAALLTYHDIKDEPGETKEIRKQLAKRLNTTPKNLSNQMARKRERLLECIRLCQERKLEDKSSSSPLTDDRLKTPEETT